MDSKHVISNFGDLPLKTDYVEVKVPEWGTKNENTGEIEPAIVLMRHISAAERRRWSAKGELGLLGSMNDTEREVELARWRDWYDSGKREVEILKMCYVKEDGSQLFTHDEAVRLMEQLDLLPVNRLLVRAEEENLLTPMATENFRKNA